MEAVWPRLSIVERRAHQILEFTAAHEQELAELRSALLQAASPTGLAAGRCLREVSKERSQLTPADVHVLAVGGGECGDDAGGVPADEGSGHSTTASPRAVCFNLDPTGREELGSSSGAFALGEASAVEMRRQTSPGSRPVSRVAKSVLPMTPGVHLLGLPEVLPLWNTEKERPVLSNSRMSKRQFSHSDTAESDSMKAGDTIMDMWRLQGLVVAPTSMKRLVWDMTSTLAIMYDLLTLPLMVFSYDELSFAHYASLATTIFWLADICFNFLVGYHRNDGCIEMRLRPIAQRYVRTWFACDLLIVMVDLALLINHYDDWEAVSAARVGKTLRAVRITRCLRMLRLLRVVKLFALFEEVCDMLLSGPMVAFFNIAKLMFGLAILAHFVSCLWYAVGTSGARTSWLTQLERGNADGDNEGREKIYHYVAAYHWTMAQFTPAPVDIHPHTFEERLFTVCVLFVGLVVFSSLLGSTTALINQSRQHAYEKMRETDLIRRFFVDNHVSLALSNRIASFFKANRRRKTRVKEDDLSCLKALPTSIQIELHYEVYSPFILPHPVFGRLEETQRAAVIDICHAAMTEVALAKGEEPFHYRMPATYMTFVISGFLDYYPGPAAFVGLTAGTSAKQLSSGDSLCEAVLWLHWEHLGLLTAAGQCSAVKVDGDRFRLAAQRHSCGFRFLRSYVQLFRSRMQDYVVNGAELDDTFSPFLSEQDLIDALLEAQTSRRRQAASGAHRSSVTSSNSSSSMAAVIPASSALAPGVDGTPPTVAEEEDSEEEVRL